MAINNGVLTKQLLQIINPPPANSDLKESTKNANPTIALSFQIMTRAEPPELVIATIRSLLAVKADNDEIIIIDNNNTDTSMYKPLAAFCASLAPELKVYFYHIDAVAGFKAGALNLALGLMDPKSTHIVVVDSDYQALPHAKVAIADAIKRYPTHALLQFPQFYRNSGQTDVHSELNHYFNHHLYRPFNRERALSTGTYAVIRRSELLDLGGWSSASITEDAQMGVLMHRNGLRTRFIPQVIATGLLPNTLNDLMSQRRRWIYGNMQVLSNYFSLPTFSKRQDTTANGENLSTNQILNQASENTIQAKSISERLGYMRAHFSQLSAWTNLTGVFILLQVCVLFIITSTIFTPSLLNISPSVTLLTPLYLVYAGYAVFLARRLWAYLQDKTPLNKQVNNNQKTSIKTRLTAWLMHLNFWELGALSWLPVLWGSEKPFICTPKQEYIRTHDSSWLSNIIALPKLVLVLNLITALIVAPFTSLYSPLLFVCALTVCLLKIGAAKVAFDNFATSEQKTVSINIKSKPAVTLDLKSAKSVKSPMSLKLDPEFEEKKIINS